MDPPWSMSIRDEAPLTIAAVVRGTAWVMYDDAEPAAMDAGDVAVMRGPDHYTVADQPGRRPQVVIGPGQVCTNLAGDSMAEEMSLGVRTWGNSADGATVLLTGTYQAAGEISRRLLDALPRLVVLGSDEWDCPVIPLLADEIGKDTLGQEVVLDRLLDLLIVAVLRAWFDRPGVTAPDRPHRSDRGPGDAAVAQQPRAVVDGVLTGCGRGRLPSGARPAVHRPGRGATDRVPHHLAAVAGRRPALRGGRDGGPGGPSGRVRQSVHVQHCVQAALRREPAGASPAAPGRLREHVNRISQA
jgi:hypothetical protein